MAANLYFVCCREKELLYCQVAELLGEEIKGLVKSYIKQYDKRLQPCLTISRDRNFNPSRLKPTH